MIKHWLSTATFSAPDDLGSGSGETVSTDHNQGGSTEPVSAPSKLSDPGPSVTDDQEKPRVETIEKSVRRAIAETKQKAAVAERAPKPPKPQKSQPAGDAAKPSSETPAEGNTETATQAASGPPQTWSKEERVIWNDLSEAARATINRREAASAKGVAELKTRYQDIDTAVAPYKAVMTQNNVTPGQAINQLFSWHMALAGPNKVAAFKQLAQSFGVDVSHLAAGPNQGAQAGADPLQNLPGNLGPVITGLETRMRGFEEQNAAAMQTAAQQTWANWSQDKPHAERVRGLMANLINGDLALIQARQPQISNTIKNGHIDMDAAYNAAIYAHPEVRGTILQEEQARRDKEARAAAEKARKAGTSMRSGAPAGAVNGGGGSNAPKVESVRESISRALTEVRGAQH